MWISKFNNYKAFLKAELKESPRGGRGQSSRLAKYLGVAPITVSQILTRDRHFSLEQAVKVEAYFGFVERKKEYFIYLVHLARADSKELKEFYTQKLNQLRAESEDVKNIVQGREELTDLEKATFYSNWYYAGVMILSSIEGYQTVETIAEYFGLSRTSVGNIVAFLLDTGLCLQDGNKIRVGKRAIHVDNKSQFVNNHRRNWREKAREKFSEPAAEDLFYSCPASISKADSEKVRKELLSVIKKFSETVADSHDEQLMCLNIDWFQF